MTRQNHLIWAEAVHWVLLGKDDSKNQISFLTVNPAMISEEKELWGDGLLSDYVHYIHVKCQKFAVLKVTLNYIHEYSHWKREHKAGYADISSLMC